MLITVSTGMTTDTSSLFDVDLGKVDVVVGGYRINKNSKNHFMIIVGSLTG
jgi:hypothetical protein